MATNIDFPRLAASLALCLIAAGIGSFFTYPAIPWWYATLEKPDFAPPDWVFAPVWTLLYALMAISFYLVWTQKGREAPGKASGPVLTAFGAQLALNVIWTFLFFGLRSPFYGMVGIVLLWLSIAWTIINFWKVSRLAAWLLVPYILWVSFASALNILIWWMNR